MRKVLGIAVVAVLFAAGTAQAQGPAASGFSLGARVGYGIPMGDADGGDPATGVPATKMSDLFSGQFPLQLDAMYRFDRSWSVGLYFQYGIASVADTTCVSGLSCSASDLRFGAQVHYRFDSQGFIPWVGLGIGGEWSSVTLKGPGGTADIKPSGFEFLNLQLGGDWLLSPNFRLGPYVQFSLAQYDTLEVTVPGFPSVSGSIANKTTHEWLQFGLKGTFDL